MIKKVVFVGNCQLQALCRLYEHLSGVDSEVSAIYIPGYENADDEQRSSIESADVVVKQVLDFDQKIGDITTSGIVHPFPHVGGAFLWPYTGQAHPLNKTFPFFDSSGPYPTELGDSFLNKMIAKGVDAESAVKHYNETDVSTVKRLDRLLDLVLEKQRARDRSCGYNFADFIHSRFRSERLFRSPNHPELPFMLMMAAQLFERLGLNPELIEKEFANPSIELVPISETPIHPKVISHFSLDYLAKEQKYRFFDEGKFTFSEYAERYMRFEWNPILAKGMYLARNGQSDLATDALTAGIINSPRSAIGKFTLSRLLTAQNRIAEAYSLAEQATRLESDNMEFKRNFDELFAAISFTLGSELNLKFGQNGNSKRFQTYGWSQPEHDFTWTDGPRAQLYLGRQTKISDYRMAIDVHPLLYPEIKFQRISVRLNNVTVSNIYAEKSGEFLIWIPGELFPPVGEALTLTFELPDAARPIDLSDKTSDSRLLGLSFSAISFKAQPTAQAHSEFYVPATRNGELLTDIKKSIFDTEDGFLNATDEVLHAEVLLKTGLTAADLATKFESLGDNCEFGLIQRRCLAEPLGLFRFSNPLPNVILQGIKSEFKELGNNARVILDEQQPRREWIVEEPDYKLRQHTFVWEGDAPESEIIKQQMMRFKLLRRKLWEDIEEGNKIFVIKSVPNLTLNTVLPIAEALRSRGPNWLLWVTQGGDAGNVEIVSEGLLHGSIDRLMPDGDQSNNFSLGGWLAVMIKSWHLVQERTTH